MARRRRDRVRRPRACVPPLPRAGRTGRRSADGDVARRRPARLPRCRRGGERLAPPGATAARATRGRPRPRLARLPRGVHRACGGRPGARSRARAHRRRNRAPLRRPRSRDARPRAAGCGAGGVRRGRGRHALPRRGDRRRARRRGNHPDLERLDVLLPRHRLHRRPGLRARVRVVRPDRRVRGALREPLHARLLPRRVRGRASVARAVGRRRGAAERCDRVVQPLAARVRGRPDRPAGRAPAPAGQDVGGGDAAGGDRSVARGAALPGAARTRRRRRAVGG